MAKKRRSRGSGSVSKRNGVFYYWYTDANGTKHAKSLRTRNRQEALKKASEFEKAVEAKDHNDVLYQSAKARGIIRERQLPLENAWKAYLETRPTCSEGTLENHRRNLEKFISWLAVNHPNVRSFTQLAEDIANDYADHLWGGGIASATFNYHRASLLAITNALSRKYGMEKNPWQSVERKNDEKQTRSTLIDDQIRSLIEAAGNNRELRALIMLGAYAGMRLKDAALLEWRNVSLKSNFIEYRPFKTRRRNKTALVPITADLRDALTSIDASGEYVLPKTAERYNDHCDPLKKSLLRLIAGVSPDHDHGGTMQRKQTRRAAGFHALRHYFCTTVANRGIPAAQLERMTGDQAKTLSQYYIRGEIDGEAVSGAFAALPKPSEPSIRDLAKNLIDSLPEETVREIVENYS